MSHGFTLFETPVGRCGIAWGDRGIVGLQLPEASAERTRARLRERFAAPEREPPRPVSRAIDSIVRMLDGSGALLDDVELDMTEVPPFARRVYQLAREIAPGKTLTYGELAQRIGSPGAARAVGGALGKNPFPIVVPCHRVLAAGGKLGGFSANGGVDTKRRLLALEAAPVFTAPARRSSSRR